MFLLEEATDADFSDAVVIYEGPDVARAISGKFDGVYHYRVQDAGVWSESVTVAVQHHSLEKALAFLAVGAIVFLATAVLIVAGHLGHRRALRQGDIEGG
jgi:hypothetical protein